MNDLKKFVSNEFGSVRGSHECGFRFDSFIRYLAIEM